MDPLYFHSLYASPPRIPSSSWRQALVSGCTISANMQGIIYGNEQLMLHCSRWHCLASTYAAEIQDLIELVDALVEPRMAIFNNLDGPLEALLKAVQEGEACMQAYIIPKENDNSWLVDKALKLAMSTDVVDVHLHNFLWASSIVREQLFSITGALDVGREAHLLEQARKLHEIWSKEDADEDLRTANSFLQSIKLNDEYRDNGNEICQLVDFILQKLSHVDEARHNHMQSPPASSPPNYMCIDSDECLHKAGLIFNNDHIEVHQVVWLGGRFVLKSFKYMDDYYDHLFDGEGAAAAIRDLFNKEAAIQARVWHPHVVPLVCCINKPPGLLMELLQEDLHALIKRRMKISENDSPFPLLMAVDLMLQIAKGMEYLHSSTVPIIHRDLKPANILVSSPVNSGMCDSNHASTSVINPQAEHLKIADFGVSKAKQDCLVYSTRNIGTVSYMAPEVYEKAGGSHNINEPKYSNKADVYSFGIVCYEILTGKAPFKPPNRTIRERVLQGERPPLLGQSCPPALSSFIQMCWHADPTQRPTFIQICRLLRYLKACILVADCCNVDVLTRLLKPPISPNVCAHIDDMIAYSLAGRTFRPKALCIPLEMYFCGVQLQKFGLPSFDNLAGWDSWNDEVHTYSVKGIKKPTKEQLMCTARWSSWFNVGGLDTVPVPPHFKRLRRFTFKELRTATNDFATIILDRHHHGQRAGITLTESWYENVYWGELAEQGQAVAVARVMRSDTEKLILSG